MNTSMDRENVENFLKELTKLCDHHGIYIMSALDDQLYLPYLVNKENLTESDGVYQIYVNEEVEDDNYGCYGKYTELKYSKSLATDGKHLNF